MGRWLSIVVGFLAVLAAPAAVAQPPPRSIFNDWTAIVVAGDWRAHSGGPTEAFDNARRDVAATLEGLGFARDEIVQFSTRPERYPDTRPARTEAPALVQALHAGAARKTGGCLVYYTSHGAPPGVVLDVRGDGGLYTPQALARLVNDTCPDRPTIVIISACFSGVFIPVLANDQRLILTAARPDRASFGCSESDHYPFFDDCFLQSVEGSRNFAMLGQQIQACVGRKERELNLTPASEPQVWIGARLRPILPLWSFPPGAKAVRRE
ncbi:C13 family peptidase [Caulobacter mirabilis]|uniref:Peptidase C13 n=1 Tax=Caulobacter mirabilis TaxID=69666 RepID=A0A2D2AWE4_9CAUL|nr:C13 family peptidase [Caulobacter mirabilis]ATQ42316.1 peptidase C13 [Caulobacter mirabilis]